MVWTGRLRISPALTLRMVAPCFTSTSRRSALTSIAFSWRTTTSSSVKWAVAVLPAATTTPVLVSGL